MKAKIAFGIVVVLAGTGFSFFSSSSLPQAQTPHAAGTLIHKNQLVFAGYNTPEATLESVYWAIVNGNYDAAIASAPKDKAEKVYGKNLKQFKSEWQNSEYKDFASLQIIARKNVSADKVELEFHELLKDQDYDQSEPGIAKMARVGDEWKFSFDEVRDYTTNWDKSGDVTVFYHHTNSPSANKTFTSQYKFGTGILISKRHLTDAGYDTPEHALETYNWAWANTNYDRIIGSLPPDVQRQRENNPGGREHFELGMKKFGFQTKALHIVAKKIIADDKVELLLTTEQGDKSFTMFMVSIQQMVKIGNDWKLGETKTVFPNDWENGSEPEPTIRR